LEICRNAGFDMDELRRLATAREDGSVVRWVTTLTGEELGALPYERQGDENLRYTPTPLLNLSQHLLEPVLLARAREHKGLDVRYRHEWESLEQDDGGVMSRIRDLANGETYEVRSSYVLAADGAGSRVRKGLGINVFGPDRIQSFVMIHFEASLRPLVAERPAILYWTVAPHCRGTFIAHDIDHSWVFMHPYDAEAEAAEAYTESRCREIVTRALGRENVEFTIRDISTWHMTAQVAERYADGRVFLVGDSAHRFPPTGGMGLNTGVQDAHNLVWKLATVMANEAPASLLDTYETERRPIAQNNADQSLANAMKMFEIFEVLGFTEDVAAAAEHMAVALADAAGRERVKRAIDNQQEHFDMFGLQLGFVYEQGALVSESAGPSASPSSVSDYVPTSRPGARVPHAWVENDGRRVSMLDLLPYDSFVLITGPEGEAWAAVARTIETPLLRCLVAGRNFTDPEKHWESVCEIGPTGALLVRPDQHVAWRAPGASGDPRTALSAALDAALGSSPASA
jgi:2,4-dichlorophenol 6-monooxygenase